MLDLQFIGTNLHFAVNLLAALVSFAVFWLVFDAWTSRRDWREILGWAGFLALSIGFLVRAATTQSTTSSLAALITTAADWLRLAGYLGISLGQISEPLQKKPVYVETLEQTLSKPPKAHASLGVLGTLTLPVLPLLSLLAGALYLRRATTGLERHLTPVAWGFGALAVFEALAGLGGLSNTTNPNLYRLVQPLGPVWWTALATLAIASLILGRWVWRYLTKRLQTQLFIILVAQTLALFLFSTIGFTFLLLQNIQKQSLADLTTASHVLDYAIASRQAETAAQAEAAATNQSVVAAVTARDQAALAKALATYMTDHNLTTLIITDASAAVLLRGEDPDRFGDSRSSDPLVRRSLVGTASSSVVTRAGVVAPTVSLVAAHPIRNSTGTIIGTVTAGRTISNAFVDGIRGSTGLDSAVYGGNLRAATTLTTAGGTDRAIGTKETSTAVTGQVLDQGKSYSGTVSLQNRPYLAAFTPLKDINNTTVGMVMVARPSDELYTTANRSIQLTFLFVVGLIVLSIYPVYLISRFLSRQLK